jgi:protease-4
MRGWNALRAPILIFAAVNLSGCVFNMGPLLGGQRGPMGLETIVPAKRFFTTDQILMIDLTGEVDIAGGGFFGGEGMLVKLKDRLEAAEANPRVKGVLLRIDSPGGGVTASDLVHHELIEFKNKKKVPVVAMMLDVAASGGVYIAMAADEIYALPTTTTGSIGVISQIVGLQGLGEKIGLEMRVIKSGDNKDLGSPWRPMTDEERRIFQTAIDGMYERFVGVVLDSRGPERLTRDRLMPLADGRILTARQAAELGLIDGVAYMDEAIDRVKELANVSDASIVSYEYAYEYRGNLYANAQATGARSPGRLGQINLFNIDLGLNRLLPGGPRFYYLWTP